MSDSLEAASRTPRTSVWVGTVEICRRVRTFATWLVAALRRPDADQQDEHAQDLEERVFHPRENERKLTHRSDAPAKEDC